MIAQLIDYQKLKIIRFIELNLRKEEKFAVQIQESRLVRVGGLSNIEQKNCRYEIKNEESSRLVALIFSTFYAGLVQKRL